MQQSRGLRGASRWRRHLGVQLQAWLPGRVLRGHGERVLEPSADPERAGRHHRPADYRLDLRQTEAETETAAQVIIKHTDCGSLECCSHTLSGIWFCPDHLETSEYLNERKQPRLDVKLLKCFDPSGCKIRMHIFN